MPPSDRFLERALLFTMVAHLAAMVSMALFLLPGIPGGTPADIASRAAYVANHAWVWRLGWFPWQVTAASDLILAVALLRPRWVSKLPAVVSLLATVVAVSIEQPNEFRWITTGVDLAREAVKHGTYTDYLRFETETNRLVSMWAAMCYTIAAICWSWTLAAAGVWNRWLTGLSVAAWGILLFVSAGPLILGTDRISDRTIAAGNACGFILMMIWFALVTELVLRRNRPADVHGRYAPWKSPYRGLLGVLIDLIANARLPRALGEWVPSVAFVSDITNVVYINYLVDAERLQPLVPEGLELQRLGPQDRYALFTFLTYRHGHFGPRLFGPLRRLLPSPVQSNWRIHVRDPHTGVTGIYFTSTAITALPNALAARFLSEGVPMHVPRQAEVSLHPDGSIAVRIDPGQGSAPDVDATLSPTTVPEMSFPWNTCFADFQAFLTYCVPQDRALSSQPWYRCTTRQEIRLDIPLQSCQPLAGNVTSRAAHQIVGDATPVCFRVPEVAFRYDGEQYDLWATPRKDPQVRTTADGSER
ncbi:MAG: hypothetical protein JWN34_3933 [Bryobacterales bacterium]|nr:hypothetical protein [Bryobacterales bacterium]